MVLDEEKKKKRKAREDKYLPRRARDMNYMDSTERSKAEQSSKCHGVHPIFFIHCAFFKT